MNRRCAGLVAVLVSLVAFGKANADISFHGVIDPLLYVMQMDSVKFTPPDTAFLTPDWGSHPPMDTFDFTGVTSWPETLRLYGTISGFPSYRWIADPLPDIWYPLGMGTGPYVTFYGDYGLEESKPSVERPPRLTVCPNVVTGQMTVKLQPVAASRPVVEIYDAVGNVVRSLGCTAGTDGAATATWNREDEFGRLVPEGIYFCRYAASDVIAVRKVLVAH